MIAFIFPGQGSQRVAMGKTLASAYPDAAAAFAEADAAFASAAGNGDAGGTPGRLSQIVFEGPEDALTLTEHAQPAILAASVAAGRVLTKTGITPAFVAGHSLGEYSAHVIAGTFGFPEAVAVVRRRGRYMQEAVPVGQGAMAAILGADTAIVERACQEAAEGEVVAPANLNAPGQVVIAGTAAAVMRAGERAKALGARRVVPLTVSAPFHCALMKPAEQRLEPELRALPVRQPAVPVVANVVVEFDGQRVTPPVSCGLLPGVLRGVLVARGEVQERVVRLADLPQVTRMWLVNSLRGWIDVTFDA